MPNKPKSQDVQLGARVSEAVKDQVEETARALGKSLKDFVEEVLNDRTKAHSEEVRQIVALRKIIAAREKSRKT